MNNRKAKERLKKLRTEEIIKDKKRENKIKPFDVQAVTL